jgi:YVTN family beta-propeller protein
MQRRSRRSRCAAVLAIVFGVIVVSGVTPNTEPRQVLADTGARPFATFEGPHVHPITLTPDGTRVLAVNTSDNRLSVFDVTAPTPALVAEIPVGLVPVSVAARNDHEAWVVNWLSDSVSVVDLVTGNVVNTIDTGDEPADVLFAGRRGDIAVVTVGGANQVEFYDASDLSSPPRVVDVPGIRPRALARDRTGLRVFVSVFESGNATAVVPAGAVAAAGGPPPAVPAPDPSLPPPPQTGLIVQRRATDWVDETGDAKWTGRVPAAPADVDVVEIALRAGAPRIEREARGIGTLVGNAAFDDTTNTLYTVNTEARNLERFEPNLKGRFADTRISMVRMAGRVPRSISVDLNRHVAYDAPAGSEAERELSLAIPGDVVRDATGTLYVAATGSAQVGILASDGTVKARVRVGPGPTGLALDALRRRLYVVNRFDSTISLVDVDSQTEAFRTPIGFDPEPEMVRAGRQSLFDARMSAHGTVACATCHADGHRDGLAWDLGNPRGRMRTILSVPVLGWPILDYLQPPQKGPMTTPSLRGLAGLAPYHWRGDMEQLSEVGSLVETLLGAPRALDSTEMAALETYLLSLAHPPNPFENLDRTDPNPSTGPSAARGREIFLHTKTSFGGFSCSACHALAPSAGAGTSPAIIPGQLLVSRDGREDAQNFKVPTLRGIYQKSPTITAGGRRIGGVGFTHDGTVESLDEYLRRPVFAFPDRRARRDVEAFLTALDTGTAPAVGLQVTLGGGSRAAALERVALLVSQADAGNCDLVARGIVGGSRRGFTYAGNGRFRSDRHADGEIGLDELCAAARAGSELTFTGVPPGRGIQMGVDRDGDGTLDGDER